MVKANYSRQMSFKFEDESRMPGQFEMVPIDKLVIPSEDELGCPITQLFQRNEYSESETKKRASLWDWLLCGTLTVVIIDGVQCVVDGGNRLRAARLRGNISHMPCMVYGEMDVSDAARSFLAIQILRKSVNATKKHEAGVYAKNPQAITADEIIKENGYSTNKCGGGTYAFDAINALYGMMKVDVDIASDAFATCAKIADGQRIYKEFLQGVFELERRCRVQHKGRVIAFNDATINKLKMMGVNGIMAHINRNKFTAIKSETTSRITAAKGVLEAINKGKRSGALRVSLGTIIA